MSSKIIFKTIFLFLLALNIGTRVYGYTAADYTKAGLQVYNQKNYALAVRYFTAALAMEPSNLRALQGRANCYYYLGKYQQALTDYEKIQTQNPSGPVSQFVQALRAKIGSSAPAAAPGSAGTSTRAASPGVSGSAGSPAIAPTLGNVAATAPTKSAGLGLRVEPVFFMIDLADFKTDAQTNQINATQTKQIIPSFQFDETVPTSYLGVIVEPVAIIGGGFEIGLPFGILPMGKVSVTGQDDSGDSDALSYALSGFSVGLNARYVFGSGPVRPFISAGGLLIPIAISYTQIINIPPNPTASISGDFSSIAFGGQGQVGVDFHIGAPFVLSLFGGYQTASASGFKGSMTTSGTGNTVTDNGQLGLAQGPNGFQIGFLKDGTTAPQGFRPLQIDLGGVLAGINLSIYF